MESVIEWEPNTRKTVLCLVENKADLHCGRMALDSELAETHDVQKIPGIIPEISDRHYETYFGWLQRYDGALKRYERVILAFADTIKHRRYVASLVDYFGLARCYRPALPGGTVTLSGVFEEYGRDMATLAILHAEPWPPVGIVRIDDIAGEVLELLTKEEDRGVEIGIDGLKEHFRARKGEFTLVHGIPSHGKTTFTINVMAHLIRQERWKFCVFSPEYYSLPDFTTQVIEHVHHAPFREQYDMHGNLHHTMAAETVEKTLRFLREYLFFMRAPEQDRSLSIVDIADMARRLDDQHDIDAVIIDPYNELDHSRNESETETEYISRQLSVFRKLARNRHMHVFLVAHPTKIRRAETGIYKGKHPPPSPYDVAGSAAFYSKPDNILCVWRDLHIGTRQEVHVQKIRSRAAGMLGKVDLDYKPTEFRYEEIIDMDEYLHRYEE